MAIALALLLGGATVAVALTRTDSPYGLALFVGAPFVVGLACAVALHPGDGWRSTGANHRSSQLALFCALCSLLLLGLEGGLCILMAYPLAAPITAFGTLVGQCLVELVSTRRSHVGRAQILLLALLTPILAASEPPWEAPLREIETTITIDATPEEVWPHVIEFTELPPPSSLAFRIGIAYPQRARIEGRGVGAVRYCEFSTGAFIEPITRWEAPHRLSFDVVAQPPTMHEWSPYGEITPRHLTESLHSERGEFRLVRLDDGRTRLEGSTWYRHALFPQSYWNLWSDALIHRIHRRVLEHIQSEVASAP